MDSYVNRTVSLVYWSFNDSAKEHEFVRPWPGTQAGLGIAVSASQLSHHVKNFRNTHATANVRIPQCRSPRRFWLVVGRAWLCSTNLRACLEGLDKRGPPDAGETFSSVRIKCSFLSSRAGKRLLSTIPLLLLFACRLMNSLAIVPLRPTYYICLVCHRAMYSCLHAIRV